jgi:hypothetical protein
MAMRVLSEA